MTIAITGATGQLGRLTVQKLIERQGADGLVALVRSPEKSRHTMPRMPPRPAGSTAVNPHHARPVCGSRPENSGRSLTRRVAMPSRSQDICTKRGNRSKWQTIGPRRQATS